MSFFLSLPPPSSVFRLRASSHVQRWVGAGEPPPGCGFQTAAGGQLRHLPKPHQETEAIPPEDGHRHGEENVCCTSVWCRFWLSGRCLNCFIAPLLNDFLHPSLCLSLSRCWQLTCLNTWACWLIWRRWWKPRKWPALEFCCWTTTQTGCR